MATPRPAIATAAVLTAAGIALVAVWPDASTQSALALTTERAIAASIPREQWPASGQCVLMEAVFPDDTTDAGTRIQRAYEVCHRVGYPESDDPAAYNSGDGVHPNQAGHDLIADTIIASGVLP